MAIKPKQIICNILFFVKDIDLLSLLVLKLVKHPINNNQFSSLVSFVFNLGINSLKRQCPSFKMAD